MNEIYDADVLNNYIQRIEKINNQSPRKWGRMNPAQMLSHCAGAIEVPLADKTPKRSVFASLFGRFYKKAYINNKPFSEAIHPDEDFAIAKEKDFDAEKQRLISVITKFSQSGKKLINNRIHPFYGKLTATEWNNAVCKHLDHHLKQFGV